MFKKTKIDNWIIIDKKEQPLTFTKINFEDCKYKTKKEALKAIEDFKKYPIYHKV